MDKFCAISENVFYHKKLSDEHLNETRLLFKNKEIKSVNKIRLFLVILQNSNISNDNIDKLYKVLSENSELKVEEKELLESEIKIKQ